jgi:uncharacterized protein
MELALQVVGLKMTGRIENAKDVAMRIVGSGHEDSFPSAPIDVSEIMQMTSGLGSAQGLEDLLLSLLSIFDLPSQSKVSVACALSLRSVYHQSLLHLAIQSKFLKLVRALLSRGVDVDARDRNGLTSLHFAVLGGWQDGIDILLQSGADLEIVDALGRTPSEIVKTNPVTFVRRGHFHNRVSAGIDISDAGEEADVEDETEVEEHRRHSYVPMGGCMHDLPQSWSKCRDITEPGSLVNPSTQSTKVDPQSMGSGLKQDLAGTPAYIYNWLRENLMVLQAGATLSKGLPQMSNISAMSISKQLPQLPEFPKLPQLPAVLPIYIPIPWPAFNRIGTNENNSLGLAGTDDDNPANTEIISIWKAVWEKCLAQMSQHSAQPPGQGDPPPEYSETRSSEEQLLLTRETKLRKRINFSPTVLDTNGPQEGNDFKYRASRVERRDSSGTRDRMLIWFWLPVLICESS